MTDAQQQWLPFDFLVEEQICRTDLPHFADPKTDNECLFEFQYQYRVNGKQEALQKIYELGLLICKKMINKESRCNKHVKKLSMEDREMKAEDAINYIISAYLRKPKWAIDRCFTAYLYRRVQHELYYKRKVDQIVDFVDLSEFYKEGEMDEWDECDEQI